MPQIRGINLSQILGQFDAGRKQGQERNRLAALSEASEVLQNGGDLRQAAAPLLASGETGGFSQLMQLANQNRAHKLNTDKFEFSKAAGQKPTTAIQNFKFGQQNPDFVDHQQNLKRAGATNVNVAGAKGETEFQKTLGKRSADMFGKFAEEGVAAQDNSILIDQISQLIPKEGGFITGIKGKLAGFGFNVGEGTSDLQAFQSLIDRLTPQQRQGLPGSASDRDVAMFKNSLPNLFNLPGGNDIIINTMSALNAAKLERGRIGNQVMTGEMTRKQAITALRSIRDPLANFKQFRKSNGAQFAKARVQPQQSAGAQQPQVTQGSIIVNPQTGQRLQFNGQTWEPVR